MTLVFRVILILVSLFTFISIIRKIRNAKVQIEYSLFWIVFSAVLLLFSIFPQIPSFVTNLLGIYSTVNFIFLFVIFILLVHQFMNSIKISQLEQKLKELTQELAVRELRKVDEKDESES